MRLFVKVEDVVNREIFNYLNFGQSLPDEIVLAISSGRGKLQQLKRVSLKIKKSPNTGVKVLREISK